MPNLTHHSALEDALSDLCHQAEAISHERSKLLRQLRELADQSRQVEKAIKSLIPLIEAGEQTGIIQGARKALAELGSDAGQSEASIDDVRKILDGDRGRIWTPEKVESELLARGFNTKSKAVYNWLNALALKKQLHRVSRGRYMVQNYGFGVETSEQLGD